MAGDRGNSPVAGSLCRSLAWALLLAGVLRLLAVAAHEPLAAYANQYDMARTSACLGLWADRPGVPPAQANPAAPLVGWRHDGEVVAGCMPSAEVAIVWAALQLNRVRQHLRGGDPQAFSLRALVWFKVLLAFAVLAWLHWRLAPWPGWQAGHAAAFALVFADPVNTLYLGTLYTEFPALLGFWLAAGSLLLLALAREHRRAPPRELAPVFALGLLLLGTARVAHAAVAAWLFVASLLAVFSRSEARLPWRGRFALPVLAFCAVLAGGALAVHNTGAHAGIRAANIVDTLFGAVLPASDRPERLVARLGLPPRCVEPVHATWYRLRGAAPLEECPEALELSRVRTLGVLAREPSALARLVGRGLMLSTQWRPAYLGEIAGAEHARLPQPSIAGFVAPRGFLFQVLLWSPVLWLLPWAAWRLRRRVAAAGILALALAGTIAGVWVIALLGDGYSELARHLHLAQNALLVLWLFLLARTTGWLRPHWRERSRWRRGVLAGGAVLVVTVFAGAAWQHLPMATGVISVPDGSQPVPSSFPVRGEVLALRAPDGLRLRLADGETQEVHPGPGDPALVRVFPIGQGRGLRGFDAELSLPPDAAGSLELHLDAREGGHWREIYRVRLRREVDAAP